MAKLGFLALIQRFIPFLGYHHLCMMVQIAGIIVTSILLAGCSSYSPMVNVYILGLSYANSTPNGLTATGRNISDTLNGFKGKSQLDVRVGYFGMCIRDRGILWLCSSDAQGLTQQIGSENDPLNLIGTAAKFKDEVLFSGLLLMSVVLTFLSLLLLSTFPGWHQERDEATGSDIDIKPFPSRPVFKVTMSFTVVVPFSYLIAILWQHVGSVGAAAMADAANYGNVKADIGAGAMVMGWTSFLLFTLVAIALMFTAIALAALDRLTDD